MSRDKIEEMAYHCLVTGNDFAKAIELLELPIEPSFDLSYRSLLGKLKNGDVLGKSDLFTVEQIGDILRAEMNAMRTGYGDRAFECYTDEDVIFDRDLELMRRAAVCYRCLMSANRALRDLSNARRWVCSLETRG
ncbi:hypothetical protein [Leisingera aquimarina]|uniref:hypothetical protein n=1 Tax=Leisingera aquimarina TaxID=476529 RepID=UPI0004862477|nr:hypothetical protein [Leisingera aquimarina]